MIAWTLYQGSLLMTVLNITGLFVNGLVCFVLPLLLVLKSMECNNQYIEANDICGEIELINQLSSYHNPRSDVNNANLSNATEDSCSLYPLPLSLEPYRKPIIIMMIIVFGSIIGLTFIIDAIIT